MIPMMRIIRMHPELMDNEAQCKKIFIIVNKKIASPEEDIPYDNKDEYPDDEEEPGG